MADGPRDTARARPQSESTGIDEEPEMSFGAFGSIVVAFATTLLVVAAAWVRRDRRRAAAFESEFEAMRAEMRWVDVRDVPSGGPSPDLVPARVPHAALTERLRASLAIPADGAVRAGG
jgi:hypothetical protein